MKNWHPADYFVLAIWIVTAIVIVLIVVGCWAF
jgi:hypothetical protein